MYDMINGHLSTNSKKKINHRADQDDMVTQHDTIQCIFIDAGNTSTARVPGRNASKFNANNTLKCPTCLLGKKFALVEGLLSIQIREMEVMRGFSVSEQTAHISQNVDNTTLLMMGPDSANSVIRNVCGSIWDDI